MTPPSLLAPAGGTQAALDLLPEEIVISPSGQGVHSALLPPVLQVFLGHLSTAPGVMTPKPGSAMLHAVADVEATLGVVIPLAHLLQVAVLLTPAFQVP